MIYYLDLHDYAKCVAFRHSHFAVRIVTLHLAHIITHIWLRIPSKDREIQLVSPVTMPNGAMGTILIKF